MKSDTVINYLTFQDNNYGYDNFLGTLRSFVASLFSDCRLRLSLILNFEVF